ncbi:signal peptidase I [Marinococcus halotolerans]|uniref:signal peptidase I n=1 Tax=Marinococcus halotolerans TaxID=301092 RepID=UPI0003B511EC|nr:signal peptidase I [Marinococcus halotolerans]
MTNWSKEIWDWIKVIVVVVLIVVIVRGFLFANYVVSGPSMLPTVEDGQRMIINKIGYAFSEPERSDIIVFHANENSDYIKRVIGLPGDTVEYRDDTLYINGEAQEEPYLEEYQNETSGAFTQDFTLEGVTGETTVPEDSYFVMGDNRPRSEDSRADAVGFVDEDQIVGEASIRYWPLDDFTFSP